MTSMFNKRCTGAHCGLRDECAHHALPTNDTRALIYPVKTGEFCDWFSAKPPKPWGHGPEDETND